MHLHSFCSVLTGLPVYISLALNYFQNKILFFRKITGRGRFSSNVPVGGYFAKKVEDHCYRRLKWMTMSILFLWRWELVILTYNVWNKTLESIFQITRGQWGTVLSFSPGLSLVHGRRKGVQGSPGFWNLTFLYYIFSKKVVFSLSRRKNEISSSLSPSRKNFMVGKIR